MLSFKNNTPLIRSIMPELDSLRGVAIIMVLLFHGFFWTADQSIILTHSILGKLIFSVIQGGWLGVQLFFILSGFLITGILLDTRERSDYFKRFYSRRALRILPIYLILLCFLLILGVIQWPFLITCLFFVSNISPIFGVVMQYAPLWTLAIEEQFYLFWPLAVRRLSRKMLAIFAIGIIVATPIIRWISFINNPSQDLYHYTWFVADGLAMGALVAIYLRTKWATHKRVFFTGIFLILIAIGVLLIGLPFGILHRSTFIGAIFQIAPWNILFAGILLLTLVIGTSNFKRIVLSPWLRFFGYISYGLYLINLLIFYEFDKIVKFISPSFNIILQETEYGIILRFLIAGGLSVLIATISRKYFEAFFLKFKDYEYFKKIKGKFLFSKK
jgi:peptidoglycan/LPS O-acetylase OafA/YrhL